MSSFLSPPRLIYTYDHIHTTTFCNRTTTPSSSFSHHHHHHHRPINRIPYHCSPSSTTRSVHRPSTSIPPSSLSYLSQQQQQDEFNVSDEIQRLTQTPPNGSQYRRNAYWAAIPLHILRTHPFFNHLPHQSTLRFKSVNDLAGLRRDCAAYRNAVSVALLTPEDIPMLFGLPNCRVGEEGGGGMKLKRMNNNQRRRRRRSRETVLQAWSRLVQVRHDAAAAAGENNNNKNKMHDDSSNKDNNAVDTSSSNSRNNNSSSVYQVSRRVEFHNRFHQWFSDTHIANAVLVYVHSERDRWHNLCLEQDPTTENLPPHWCHSVQLHEVGLILQHPIPSPPPPPPPPPHSFFFQWQIPLTLTPIAHVLRRGVDIFWNWQAHPDVILLHDILTPFTTTTQNQTTVHLRPPSPTLALNQLLRAQTILDASPRQLSTVHLVAYAPYGGAVVFEIRRHEELCDGIREYVERFFELYVDTGIVPPPSYWRGLKGQKVFDIAEQVIESHVSVLSVVPPNVAECYLIKARKSMSDWEKSRAEPVFVTHLDNNNDDDSGDGDGDDDN